MKRYPWYVALPTLAGAVAAVWIIFYFHQTRRHDPIDTFILCFMGAGWTVTCLFMVAETKGWTLRALGVLAALSGDAVLYSALGGGAWGVRWLSPGVQEGVLDLARACLLVGMPLVLYGVLATLWYQHRAGRARDSP